MIHIAKVDEPGTFHQKCRVAGRAWLATVIPADKKRPKDLWSNFRDDLREEFGGLCGYYAMKLLEGQVDHFISWDGCKTTSPHLAYEWSNYRFIAGSLNSKKRALDDNLLDPCKIQNGWFEVDIPSLILRPTPSLPVNLAAKAQFTLNRLDLEQGYKAISLRWEWYDMHINNDLSLIGLKRVAPLVALAVEKWVQQGKGTLPNIPKPIKQAIR